MARKQLRNENNPSDLALKKPQVAEARARLKAAQADLEQTRLNLDRTAISLPFSGRLVSTRVDVGQYVAPGSVLGRAFATDVVAGGDPHIVDRIEAEMDDLLPKARFGYRLGDGKLVDATAIRKLVSADS